MHHAQVAFCWFGDGTGRSGSGGGGVAIITTDDAVDGFEAPKGGTVEDPHGLPSDLNPVTANLL